MPEFVGGCADISKRVMQDEVFEMHEFAVDPERGMDFEEMRAGLGGFGLRCRLAREVLVRAQR
jgi:hypothetical protein